jgi:hypothetical protein
MTTTAAALALVCALTGAKGSTVDRASGVRDPVRDLPVVLELRETIVAVTREEDIVIEPGDERSTSALRDEWRGETALTRVRAAWWQRLVRVVEAM